MLKMKKSINNILFLGLEGGMLGKGTYEYFLNFYQKQIYMHGEQKKNTNT